MDTVELKPGIFWVGAVDWAIRDFHGYVTPRGSTYNNYLILDEDITLVDAVKLDFADVSIDRIKNLTDFKDIKNVVVNHIEPDHAGGLGEMMNLMPQATIHITERGKKGLSRFFDISAWDMKVVRTGDTLKTGKRTLLFIETPMIHWPDSMMTYVKEDKLLISQDGFGQHMASADRFDGDFISSESEAELKDAVWDYYANILMPFGKLIKRKIEEIRKMGLEIDMIAPDHGVIWRNPERVIKMYLDMIEGKADERVAIIYDTMWHGTEKMAAPIAEGVLAGGLDCRVMKLRATPVSQAVKELWLARGALIGSPTLNGTVFPKVGELLAYLKGLRPHGRILSAFGSFGWGGGAVSEIIDKAKAMGLETVEPGLQVNYKASAEDEKKCYEFGREFAGRVREYHEKF